MKKTLIVAVVGGALIGTDVYADLLIADIDTTDLTMYSSCSPIGWDGNDINPMDLNNNSLAAEENWVEALLGLEYDDPDLDFVAKIANIYPETNVLTGYDPGLTDNWDYYIVKTGKISYAMQDDGDGLVTWNGADFDMQNAVSHLSFLSLEKTEPIPEPATILLMGAGMAALVTRRRKKR
ncbi:PEP-CTERM sorting domain-containing protein [Desulfosediminicola sp.]|uniref:PEP-CTERM sorting domain-containing protein n=1 Tax=Desulfosediminicola sp. TaxID=2886825 RepID=UPI003AF27D04